MKARSLLLNLHIHRQWIITGECPHLRHFLNDTVWMRILTTRPHSAIRGSSCFGISHINRVTFRPSKNSSPTKASR
ncbi:hypothetical protein F2P81_004945 [Scophthalmus maximus]|uniref:Uncharacterized protein n=1 Tax=Scophthalmus maximus TaxID=52904 RepID=A0A6A4TGM7_SCOMX|nr:hypothetical protein F2P81_004945 [Scophthalmus maximus]